MTDRYFEVYLLTHSRIGKIVRFLLFLLAILLVYLSFTQAVNFRISISFLALVIINELFIEHLASVRPREKVQKDLKDPKNALMFTARKNIENTKNVFEIVKKATSRNDVAFFKQKLGLEKIEEAQISKEEFLKQAQELVVWIEGTYITDVDLFASYVLLSEDTTHFLQDNELNNDDVINILYWARRNFAPDAVRSAKIQLLGPGVFDGLVYGWNYELKKYARDISTEVMAQVFPPTILSRNKEYKELKAALAKHAASNALLVGETGVGKGSLVARLAYDSFIAATPYELSHRKVFELFVYKLISGVSNTGELEERLGTLVEEIAHSGNSIIYIKNLENILGGGGFNFDITGLLVDYLNGTKIKIIGSTTREGFTKYIQNREGIASLFEKIDIEELPEEKTILLLTDKAREVEAKYGVQIKYSALKQVVNLSNVYFPERFSPGRDLNLLENAASRCKVDKQKIVDGQKVIELVQTKTKVILDNPDKDEKVKLINLEQKLHERVIGQNEAIVSIADAMRRLRSGFKDKSRPIGVFLFLGPTGVGKTEVAKALAQEYFGSRESMIRLDMSEYQTQDQIGRILGGGEYVSNNLVELIERNPFSLILLDEFEKAHPKLLDIFLQVFDEGRLTDNRGKTISFKNSIIIATSNAGAELIRERENTGTTIEQQELIDYLLKNNIFKPELINRFDNIVMFKFLSQTEIEKIAGILLSESLGELKDNQISIEFDDKTLSKIAKEAYDPEFGARTIRRYIEDKIEGFISKEILADKVKKGSNIVLSVDESNNFVVT